MIRKYQRSGDAIPLGARIVAVADAYSALTSWRPYREQWEYRAALKEIEIDTAKGKFDPEITEYLRRLLDASSDSEDVTVTKVHHMQKTA